MSRETAPLSRFNGRRVFITGDTGFKGAWLALWLRGLGAEVSGYALPPKTGRDLFVRLGLKKLIRHQEGDIRDAAKLSRAVRQAKPEFLFHLAAQSLVRRSYAEPALTFETNVQGSLNVLEAARACPSLRALVYVTSDKCYENRGLARGYTEEDRLGGADPYSASKACAELVLSSYQNSFFKARARFGAAAARAGNVIGGGDWAEDRIVPDAARAMLSRKTLVLRNPKALRPWQHVLDPLYGYLLLAARLFDAPERHAQAWNFGPDAAEARSVLQLVRGLSACWGDAAPKVVVKPSPLHEAAVLKLDASKARKLGWRPRWDFAQAVNQTAAWYEAVAGGEPELAVTRRQIEEYVAGGGAGLV